MFVRMFLPTFWNDGYLLSGSPVLFLFFLCNSSCCFSLFAHRRTFNESGAFPSFFSFANLLCLLSNIRHNTGRKHTTTADSGVLNNINKKMDYVFESELCSFLLCSILGVGKRFKQAMSDTQRSSLSGSLPHWPAESLPLFPNSWSTAHFSPQSSHTVLQCTALVFPPTRQEIMLMAALLLLTLPDVEPWLCWVFCWGLTSGT